MPNPKHKISRSRGRKRRTHQKLTPVALTKCNNCGAAVQMHRVCPECGHYKGKKVIDTQATA